MPLIAELVLPSGTEGEMVTRRSFVNRADIYVVALDVPVAADSLALTTLRFGFSLYDAATGASVSVAGLKNLWLSNDPYFTPEATLYLTEDSGVTALPNLCVTTMTVSANQVRLLTLQTGYDLAANTQTTALASSALIAPERTGEGGLFQVENWPLSASGGRATVYLIAEVDGGVAGTALYPGDGSGAASTLLWQAHAPSRPGQPTVDSPGLSGASVTGPQTSWRFQASSDQETGLARDGIARYLITLFTAAPSDIHSTSSGAPRASRLLFPGLSALPLGATNGFDYNDASGGGSASYTANSSRTTGSPLALTGGDGARVFSSATFPVAGSAVAYADMTLSVTSGTGAYSLQMWRARPDGSDALTDSVEVQVSFGGNAPSATLIRRAPGASPVTMTRSLPAGDANTLLAGGSVILIVAPISASVMLAESYFIPASSVDLPYLLVSEMLPLWTGTVPYQLGVGAGGQVTGGSATLTIAELAVMGGQAIPGADINEGLRLGGATAGYVVGQVTGGDDAPWNTALVAGADFTSLSDGSTTLSNSASDSITLAASPASEARSALEIVSARPSWSGRLAVDVRMTLTGGEFYVAFSGQPPTSADERPLSVRCDEQAGESLALPGARPTLLVGFSFSRRLITVYQRGLDRRLTVRAVRPFAPVVNQTLTVQVDAIEAPGTGRACALLVTEGNGSSALVSEHLEGVLPTETSFGLYAAVGVRSDLFTESPMPAAQSGQVTLFSLGVRALPPLDTHAEENQIGFRHFDRMQADARWDLMGQGLLIGRTDLTAFPYSGPPTASAPPTIYVQKVRLGDMGPFCVSVAPAALQVRYRLLSPTLPPARTLRVRLFATDGSGNLDITTPLSDWSAFADRRLPFGDGSGRAIPFENDAAMLPLTNAAALSANQWLYLAVDVPSTVAVASAVSPGSGNPPRLLLTDTDGTTYWGVDDLYHKLYAGYTPCGDNDRHGAQMQLMLRSASQVDVSSDPSRLSLPVTIDLYAPVDPEGALGRPRLEVAPSPYAPDALAVTVRASDLDSGLLAVRFTYEGDRRQVRSTPWLGWWDASAGCPPDSVQWTLPLAGLWCRKSADDQIGSHLMRQNLGGDGPRRLWAQVMDSAGNIADSYPVTALRRHQVIVDTQPPLGAVRFIDPAIGDVPGTALEQTSDADAWLRLDARDLATDVKDFRLRSDIGDYIAPEFGPWTPMSEFAPVDLSDSRFAVTDGLRRVEVQFRDFGNNATPFLPLWDRLSRSADGDFSPGHTRLFTAAALWQAPGLDLAPCVYLAATEVELFDAINYVDASDPAYAPGVAFRAISYGAGSDGRQIALRADDQIVVLRDGSATGNWTLDAARGLVVLNTPLSGSEQLIGSVAQTAATLYRWDGNALLRCAYLGNLGERLILCLSSDATERLYLGCASGNLYGFDGALVSGPYFTAAWNGAALPITFLHAHQFSCEDAPYLYLGTATVPRLFRAPLPQAKEGGAWSLALLSGSLGGSSGDLTCATSAYGALFLGMAQGKVIRYTRRLNRTNVPGGEERLVTEISLHTAESVPGEAHAPLPVASLASGGGVLFAAIGDRPEIYSYAERRLATPAPPETWLSFTFDRYFALDPGAWLFYGAGGQTFVRQSASVVWDTRTQSGGAAVNTSGILEGGKTDRVRVAALAGGGSTVFTLSGNAWQRAVEGRTSWTLEFTMQRLSGAEQGFEISDGRYQLSVTLGNNTLSLVSGTRTSDATFGPPVGGIVSAFSASGAPVSLRPPGDSTRIAWNFSASGTQSGMYAIDDGVTVGDPENWEAGGGVVPGSLISAIDAPAAGSVLQETPADGSAVVNFLRVTPAAGADRATIFNSNFGGISVVSESRLYVRLRLTNAVALSGVTLRAAWSATTQPPSSFFGEWAEAPLATENDFVVYELSPPWQGEAQSLAIEVVGLTAGTGAGGALVAALDVPTVDIDYIAVADLAGFVNNMTDDPVPVRITASGRRVQAFVGLTEVPLIDEDNLLTLPTNAYRLRFGKGDADDTLASEWAWYGCRFSGGEATPPVTRELDTFRLSGRLPSAGAARILVPYGGSIWALTDGIGTAQRLDNPDYRQMQTFAWNPSQSRWDRQDPPTARVLDSSLDWQGLIRPLCAVPYDALLLVAGQTGPLVPTEGT